jgi:hypothetical protein
MQQPHSMRIGLPKPHVSSLITRFSGYYEPGFSKHGQVAFPLRIQPVTTNDCQCSQLGGYAKFLSLAHG